MIKKHYLLSIFALLLVYSLKAQSNLASFEISGRNNKVFKGYAEPKNSLTSSSSTIKSRILIFPEVLIDENSLIVRNQIGDKVNISNYSDYNKLTARINLELKANVATEEDLLFIIAEINPGIKEPMRIEEKPIQPVNTGNNDDYYQRMAIYNSKLNKWKDSRKQAKEYLAGYQVVPVNPKSLEFNIIVNGVAIKKQELTTNSTVATGIFQVNIPFSDELFNFRLLLEQDYIVQSEFQYLTSKFKAASAIKDVNSFVNFSASHFKREIVRAQSSTSGFLFWKSTRRSIKRYVEEQSRQNLSSGTVSKYEYTVYDGDENLQKQVDNFLFPETTITTTIANHINAAQKAIERGEDKLADAHKDYADFLQSNASSLADINHINPLGALTSLSQGNIAGFLAQGVAFSNGNSSGTFTCRRMVSGNFSESDTKEFNALIFKSLYENHLFTSKPKKTEVGSTTKLPTNLSPNFELIEGGKFRFGERVNYPTSSSTTTPFSFDFSNSSYTNDQLTEIDSFWIGKYEVTQAEWKSIMNYNNSEVKGNNLPITNITWLEAIEFCNKLSIKNNLDPVYSIILHEVQIKEDANGFRLPTTQEWEYAAKGGQKSKGYYFSGSNEVDKVAWWQNNTSGQIQNVGRKKSNELGLFDMSGNVIEWCYTSKADLPLQTGQIHVADSPKRKITKGGSYRTYESRLTPWSGSFYYYNQKYKWIGLRVILPKK